MKKNIFDVEKMSRETGISAFNIKKNLNIPLVGECKAATAKEAKEVYDKLPHSCPEETNAVVLKRWSELFLLEAEKVTSDKEMKELCNYMPPELEEKPIILGKWNKLSLVSIKRVNTLEGAKEVYNNLPHSCPVETKDIVLMKWNELSLLEIEEASTTKEAKEAYRHIPPGSLGARKTAWEKWIEFSNTLQEVKEAESSIRNYYHDPDDCYEPDININNLLLKKKVELSTTVKELDDFYFWVFSGRNVTLSTIKIFCFRWVDLSTTTEEVLNLYGRKQLDPESESTAIKKIASFYGWKK